MPTTPDDDLGHLQATVVDRTVELLLGDIQRGVYLPGTRLIQGDVAAKFGVSATAVRESFHVLERLGLITWDGRRGARIFNPSPQDLVAAYEIRAALESLAVRMATPHLGQQDWSAMADLLNEIETKPASEGAFLPLNFQFHAMLAAKSGSRRLTRLIEAEQTATSAYIAFLGGVETESWSQTHAEHRGILQALRSRDADLAAKAMADHLTNRATALATRFGL